MSRILRKIFYTPRSRGRWLMAGIGLSLGLGLLMMAGQLYLYLHAALAPRSTDSYYALLQKTVSLGNTLFMQNAGFSPAEIRDLKQQPFVEKLGIFTANQFEVSAYSRQIGFYSELFFEAVPDEFLDIQPSDWSWSPGQAELPVILSQDMLNLYNFGYAMGKGGSMPQISPSTARLLRLRVRVKGARGELELTARLVGFSERLPTILVPPAFMDWANEHLGSNAPATPSRLIIKLRNPADPRLGEYIQAKGYQVNDDRLQISRYGGIAQSALAIVGSIGGVFALMAVSVFLLNFRLLLAEARPEIALLRQLGYPASRLVGYLLRGFAIYLGIIGGLVALGLYGILYYIEPQLALIGINHAKGIHPQIWLSLVVILGSIVLANALSLGRDLRRIGV